MTATPLRSVRLGSVALRLRPRVLAVCLALAALVAAVLAVSLMVGDYPIALPDVVAALSGRGERLDVFFVREVRLPRALTATLVGAALGMAGAVFQSLSRNPLGSPDIIGFTAGASTGAVLTILVLGGGMLPTALGAMLGGVGTAVLVYLLAVRRGVQGYRLVLVGIGVSAMLSSVTHYLITRAELTDALTAQVWMVGTLNSREWSHVAAVGVGSAVLVPFLLRLGARLRLMEMGDDIARALGVPTQRTQSSALVAASALTGIAIAVSGPIAFVALAAPQLARRLTRADGTTLVASALMGAALLLCSDLVALRLLAPVQLPVGVVTTVVGGTYLVWLLYSEWRGGRA
ncbi:iron chelate uptake ABC transporter family permease subunit [Thermobifida halotolerans]|uniref:Iron chelate uptake ABC transporter family permease subunit n=1 Tax=Thermobifida halotolerans TaxID=483545 RepID=A0A399G1D0_9ACTN|nr:iron chelate uptake ABC transporter family permease subunit [Thermobifida halotolerans]UOE19409.1 iron chelate uptake ABC transporter family permease subunit [Thermobifida halotolerans]